MLANPRSSRHTPLLIGIFKKAFQQGTAVFVESYIKQFFIRLKRLEAQLHAKVSCFMVLRWLESLLRE